MALLTRKPGLGKYRGGFCKDARVAGSGEHCLRSLLREGMGDLSFASGTVCLESVLPGVQWRGGMSQRRRRNHAAVTIRMFFEMLESKTVTENMSLASWSQTLLYPSSLEAMLEMQAGFEQLFLLADC